MKFTFVAAFVLLSVVLVGSGSDGLAQAGGGYAELVSLFEEFRGFSPDDIEKLMSGNLMRVWGQVEEYAAAQAG